MKTLKDLKESGMEWKEDEESIRLGAIKYVVDYDKLKQSAKEWIEELENKNKRVEKLMEHSPESVFGIQKIQRDGRIGKIEWIKHFFLEEK